MNGGIPTAVGVLLEGHGSGFVSFTWLVPLEEHPLHNNQHTP